MKSRLFIATLAALLLAAAALVLIRQPAPETAAPGRQKIPPAPTAPPAEPAEPEPAAAPAAAISADLQTAFRNWLGQWRSSASENRAALLPEGIRLAQLRRDWLLGLIQNDPAAALENALSPQELAALPPEIAALCESRFDASAFYGVLAVCGDTSPEHIHGPACRIEREVRPGGLLDPRRLIAHTFGPGLARKTEENTRVTGIVLDDHIAVAPPQEGSP